ncbi:hypothetical protein GXB85_09085 [Cellulomonas sp. APG4]|uniref:hypothetical protein n=1 Tax=Cellulomonas sp. APG4 TaxID=1538656 RepID=UPI00137AF019|nr:hypothetical protein [Cellulomonas sp. APG4]NCT91101.1 hypothetical protein [Cellulomonas sp. APG4]
MAQGAGSAHRASLQLTTVLRRLGHGPGVADPPAVRAAAEPEPHVVRATAARALTLLPTGARDRVEALTEASAAAGDTRGSEVLARTLAATWSLTAVAELAGRWAGLDGPTRRAVHDPVAALAHHGRQSDGTTCGPAVLTMLAAAGDPALALWLATGELVRSGRPPELAGAPQARLDTLREAPPARRFAPVQRVLHRRSCARSLLGLTWPGALGTPPWGAAREARFAGVAFTHVAVADTDVVHLRAVLDAVVAAVDRGVPVPLYSGGDLRDGPWGAVPRHVVLVVGRDGDTLVVWEPSAGRVLRVRRAALERPTVPSPALGRWRHVTWAVLPVL